MYYDYKCRACEHEFNRSLRMDDRKIPESEPCPSCKKEGTIYLKIGAPGFSTDTKSQLTRAGSDWQDHLKRIKQGSGRDNSIHD